MDKISNYSESIILNKKPVTIGLYNEKVPDNQIGGVVTSPFITESSSRSSKFHPDGLFSEIIFGEIGSRQRFFQFGEINLHTTVFHPMIFQDLIRLKRLYNGIMSGGVYAKFDTTISDFVQCLPDDVAAETGYSFFMNNFHKIKFDETTKSLNVSDKIKLIKQNKDKLFITKWLVIPAELREYRIENGRGTSDEINNLYLSLLNLSRVDSGRTSKDSPLYDGLRYKIQIKVLDIVNYIKDILQDEGYLERKYSHRAVAWGTRNIISPLTPSSKMISDVTTVKYSESLVPTFQCAKAFQPLVVNKLINIFFNPIITGETTQILAIDKQTLNNKYIEISEKEKAKFITIDGLGDLLNLFKDKSFRRNELVTYDVDGKQYYLYLVYDDGDTIYLSRSRTDIEKYFKNHNMVMDATKLRSLTIFELVYISLFFTIQNKHVLITRYPITWVDSMYPSKIKLSSTVPARNIKLKSLFNDAELVINNYPTIDGISVDSLKLHPGRLLALGADHDGDAINMVGVMTDEANEEIAAHMKSLNYYLDVNGNLNETPTEIIEMFLYAMSYMPK